MTGAADRHLRLYTELRARICLLDYPPGMRLSEEQLAAEFGISRTPLRRVLARLEDEGLVQSRHGVGTLVTEIDLREMAQVYDLRMELAQLAGTLSPATMDAERLAQMTGFVARGEALAEAPQARSFAALNIDHHGFMLTLIDNAALREVTDRLFYQTARIWLQSIPRMDLPDECAIFADELRQLQGALEAGDMQAAALLRRAHISMSFRRLSAAAPQGSPARSAASRA